MIYSILSGSFGESFTRVGKPAPPMPTMPASPIRFRMSSLDISESGFTGAVSASLYSPSFSMTIQSTLLPVGLKCFSSAFTVPDTDAYTGADTKPPASAIFWPFNTWSPFFTAAMAGAPMCWDSGYTRSPCGSTSVIGWSFARLLPSLGWIPPLKVKSPILLPFLSLLRFQFSHHIILQYFVYKIQ